VCPGPLVVRGLFTSPTSPDHKGSGLLAYNLESILKIHRHPRRHRIIPRWKPPILFAERSRSEQRQVGVLGDGGVEALEEALDGRRPSIFNTDQGGQFTSNSFNSVLEDRGISISMDGRGRALGNVFVERLWRSVKYEEVYLHDYATPVEAQQGLERYFRFYNKEWYHQALNYRTPGEVCGISSDEFSRRQGVYHPVGDFYSGVWGRNLPHTRPTVLMSPCRSIPPPSREQALGGLHSCRARFRFDRHR